MSLQIGVLSVSIKYILPLSLSHHLSSRNTQPINTYSQQKILGNRQIMTIYHYYDDCKQRWKIAICTVHPKIPNVVLWVYGGVLIHFVCAWMLKWIRVYGRQQRRRWRLQRRRRRRQWRWNETTVVSGMDVLCCRRAQYVCNTLDMRPKSFNGANILTSVIPFHRHVYVFPLSPLSFLFF